MSGCLRPLAVRGTGSPSDWRGHNISPIADNSPKPSQCWSERSTARPRDPDHYFALGAAHHMRGSLRDAIKVWVRGAEVQDELARQAGLSLDTRYLGTMFTRMIGHTAYFDTFAKRKLLGLASEKYVVLADRTNIGNAAYVECWRDHFDIIDDQNIIRRKASITRLREDYPTVLLVDGKWRFIHDAAVEVESRWHEAGRGPLLVFEGRAKKRWAPRTRSHGAAGRLLVRLLACPGRCRCFQA
jgi:hypothetical protein